VPGPEKVGTSSTTMLTSYDKGDVLEKPQKPTTTARRMLTAMAETVRSIGGSMLAGVVLTGQALED